MRKKRTDSRRTESLEVIAPMESDVVAVVESSMRSHRGYDGCIGDPGREG